MSSNANDCSKIEQRINEHNLYVSTTQEQVNKLDPHDADVQNEREALTRKLGALQEQLSMLQQALEDCRQGKGANFPPFDIIPEGDAR